jgi:predicted metal-dependent hydrolase
MRDTRSRWGSCSSQGTLMYSWRLIMAPPEVLRYVAAHEVAHLAEMNHSPAFWQVVQTLYGAHHRERGWLREHGASLHKYRFTSSS